MLCMCIFSYVHSVMKMKVVYFLVSGAAALWETCESAADPNYPARIELSVPFFFQSDSGKMLYDRMKVVYQDCHPNSDPHDQWVTHTCKATRGQDGTLAINENSSSSWLETGDRANQPVWGWHISDMRCGYDESSGQTQFEAQFSTKEVNDIGQPVLAVMALRFMRLQPDRLLGSLAGDVKTGPEDACETPVVCSHGLQYHARKLKFKLFHRRACSTMIVSFC